VLVSAARRAFAYPAGYCSKNNPADSAEPAGLFLQQSDVKHHSSIGYTSGGLKTYLMMISFNDD